MNDPRILIISAILLLAASFVFARGNKEKPPEKNIVQVTGKVSLVGPHHFSEVVITNDEGTWYIAYDEKDKLYQLQHQTVTVEGEEIVYEVIFASGMSGEMRHRLSNVTVIKVE